MRGEAGGSAARIDAARLSRVRVLFEDDFLLIVDKPGSIAVHGGANNPKATLLEVLAKAYGLPVELHLLNRLDRGTSGIVALAKDAEAAREVQARWEDAEKRYLAVVFGEVGVSTLTERVEHKGELRAAETRITPIAELDRISPKAMLVVAEPITGRTHQIRQHLAGAGHPIAFDDQHGDFRANKDFAKASAPFGFSKKAMLLHAASLAIQHPRTLRRVRVTSLPSWIDSLLRASAALSSTPDAISRNLG